MLFFNVVLSKLDGGGGLTYIELKINRFLFILCFGWTPQGQRGRGDLADC